MIEATNVTMRVNRTTLIASSHSDILTTTKNHLPKIASSLDTTWVRMPATHSLRDQSLGQLLKHNNKHMSMNVLRKSHLTRSRKTIDKYAMIM
jgi:hypothetical protein